MKDQTSGHILVIGASGYLGREVVSLLELNGFVVIPTGHTRVDDSQIAQRSTNHYGVDLTKPESIKALIKTIQNQTPSLRAIVNCAAGFYKGPFSSMSTETIEELTYANFLGPVLLLHEALPLLRGSSVADVINVTSISAATDLNTSRSSSMHIATKAALHILGKLLMSEWVGSQVRVTSLAPSTFEKPDRPGIPVRQVAGEIVRLIQLPPDTRIGEVILRPDVGQA